MPRKPSEHALKVLIKMFRPSSKYPARDIVPLTLSYSSEGSPAFAVFRH